MFLKTTNIKSEIYAAPTGRFTTFTRVSKTDEAISTVSVPNVRDAIAIAVRNGVTDLIREMLKEDCIDRESIKLLGIEYDISDLAINGLYRELMRNSET